MKRMRHPDHNDPTTWLHISEVMKLIGRGRDATRRLVEIGALHPIRDARGDQLFDPDEVNAWSLAHPRIGARVIDDGQLAAAAAKLFDEGVPRREVVQRLQITFDRVDALREEYDKGDFPAALRARRQEREAAAEREREQQRDKKRKRLTETLKTLRGATALAAAARPPERK